MWLDLGKEFGIITLASASERARLYGVREIEAPEIEAGQSEAASVVLARQISGRRLRLDRKLRPASNQARARLPSKCIATYGAAGNPERLESPRLEPYP